MGSRPLSPFGSVGQDMDSAVDLEPWPGHVEGLPRATQLGIGIEIGYRSVSQAVSFFFVRMLATAAMTAAALPVLEIRRGQGRRSIPYFPTRVPLSHGSGCGLRRRICLQLDIVYPKPDPVGWLRPYPEGACVRDQRVKNTFHQLAKNAFIVSEEVRRGAVHSLVTFPCASS
jgi:hypothetical protein